MSLIIRTLLHSLLALLLIVLPTACKSDTPDDVLSAVKMEAVLYDYHLAQSLAQQSVPDSADFYTRLYQSAVFQKHGINKAKFDHSMQWYERHTDKLKKIYEHLAEKLGGSTEGAINSPAPLAASTQSSTSDTLSIWRGPSSTLLNSQNLNRFKYTLRPDTALHAGDMLQWSFDVNWFYHDGERRLVACAVIHYEGDSIATMQKFVYSSGQQTTSITLGQRKVKSIDCFIYQCAPWSDRVRIATISRLRMIRLRSRQKGNTPQQQTSDSTLRRPMLSNPQIRLRDSLMRQDTANQHKSHFI